MVVSSLLSERQFHLVWRLGLYQRRGLLLEDGRAVEVAFAGHPAAGAGPDFRGAHLRFAGRDVTGDVELHRTPAEWRHHRHSSDSAYSGVVLHVALRRDPFSGRATPFGGLPIPELVLEPYLEMSVADLSRWTGGPVAPPGDEPKLIERIEELGWARYERRRRSIDRVAQVVGRDEAVYREILTALGYRANKAPFAELARLVPWSRVRPERNPGPVYQEAASNLKWRTRCGRPANHPRRRLEGWCALLSRTRDLLRLNEASIVEFSGGRIGADRAQAIMVNVILPARGDREGLARQEGVGVPGPVREACQALHLPCSRVATVVRQWGVMEYLQRIDLLSAGIGG